MKKSRSVMTATDHAKPVQEATPRQPEDVGQDLPDESESLSPKRIRDGVATKTRVLDGILARENFQFRHWGINE